MPKMDRRGFFRLLGKVTAAGIFAKGFATGGVVNAHTDTSSKKRLVARVFNRTEPEERRHVRVYKDKPQPIVTPLRPNSFILCRLGGLEVPVYLTSFNCTDSREIIRSVLNEDGFVNPATISSELRLECEFHACHLSPEQLSEMDQWNGTQLMLKSSIHGMAYEGRVLVVETRLRMGVGEVTIGCLEMIALDDYKVWQRDLKASY